MNHEQTIVLFQEKNIRRVWHDDEWYFAVNDVIAALTDSLNPADYFRTMLKRDIELKKGVGQFVLPLPIPTNKGVQKLKCTNRQTLLRIIMSIPSSKAEPFKQWLAMVGEAHLEEIENPELGFERLKEIYKAKGYPNEWIETRLKGIGIRKELTDEWQKRGVKEGQEYSILTATIAKNTFGMTPNEHSKLKGLEKQNLRDHMTNLELVFTMLGEELTRVQTLKDDAQGFNENHDAAVKGGEVAGESLKNAEQRMGIKIVSPDNFLPKPDEFKNLPDDENK